MRFKYPLLTLAALLPGLGIGSALAAETILYWTDFSNFDLGDGVLVGNDGWQSSHPDQAVHGTIDDVFQDGNRSGTIGYGIPEGDAEIVTLWRPINVDPLADQSLIHFSSDLAIIDSDNGHFDSFYISVFNQQDALLASVVFDNTEDAFGIWRYDGDEFYDTLTAFDHARVYHLAFTIDYASNRWSADLDDISLFESAAFTVSPTATRNLGDVAAEWEITDLDNPGTNWMYFDNWSLTQENLTPEPEAPPNVEPPITPSPDPIPLPEHPITPNISILPNGHLRLSWPAEPGTTFLVEHSQDLIAWHSDHPNAQVTATPQHHARFTDRSPHAPKTRFYRIRRP